MNKSNEKQISTSQNQVAAHGMEQCSYPNSVEFSPQYLLTIQYPFIANKAWKHCIAYVKALKAFCVGYRKIRILVIKMGKHQIHPHQWSAWGHVKEGWGCFLSNFTECIFTEQLSSYLRKKRQLWSFFWQDVHWDELQRWAALQNAISNFTDGKLWNVSI